MTAETSIFSWTAKWLSEKGWRYEALPVTGSTSDQAKKGAFIDQEFMVYLAGEQLHGRGRGDATWSSSDVGTSLMATWSFSVDRSPQPLTAPLVGLAVYQSVIGVWPDLPWSLKAPNDVYLGESKVCGLLVESISRGSLHRLMIGVGMNVFSSPRDVPAAGHLSQYLRSALLESIWFDFLHRLHQGFLHVAQESANVTLGAAQRLALAEALRRHPTSSDLKDVTTEGNLIFPQRSVSWNSL